MSCGQSGSQLDKPLEFLDVGCDRSSALPDGLDPSLYFLICQRVLGPSPQGEHEVIKVIELFGANIME